MKGSGSKLLLKSGQHKGKCKDRELGGIYEGREMQNKVIMEQKIKQKKFDLDLIKVMKP